MTRMQSNYGTSTDLKFSLSPPDLIRQIQKPGVLTPQHYNNNGAAESLGATAIASLLGRCKQVQKQ